MSRPLRERLEAAQARHRDALAEPDSPPQTDALLRTLQDETERFERTASALRRRIDAHRERQRLLDELRSGRPLHPAAWLAMLALGWALLSAGQLPPAPWWVAGLLVGLASVEGWCWVKQVKRSARLRSDYGSLGSPENVDADLERIFDGGAPRPAGVELRR